MYEMVVFPVCSYEILIKVQVCLDGNEPLILMAVYKKPNQLAVLIINVHGSKIQDVFMKTRQYKCVHRSIGLCIQYLKPWSYYPFTQSPLAG